MAAKFPGFIGAGCSLHILHLMFMRSVIAAFGEQIKPGTSGGAGQNGVLRCPFMVDYLIKLKPHSWLDWAKGNGYGDIARLTVGSSEGRWWSVGQALIDLWNNWAAYSAYFTYMANADKGSGGQQSVYTPLYKEVSAWLLVNKLKADIAYVLGHGKSWWNDEFQRNQDSATWMKALPEEDRLGGFRCDELPVEAVLLRWHLLGLNPIDAANVAFAEWRAELAKLSPEERAAALLQDEAFRRTTKEVQYKHHYRYLTLLLPCAIYHPNRKLGVALCAALLAAHGGIAAPESPWVRWCTCKARTCTSRACSRT
jgi:hypothetical protein